MSNPTDPTDPNPDAQPTEAYGQPVAPPLPPYAQQPTQAYGQPPQAFPDAQPTQAYSQPPAAYGQPPYGAPAVKAPDTRPKTMAWIALGAGILGFVLVLVAFIPLLWVSFVLALLGGVLLFAALVIGIIALVNKKQGGTGIGIAAIIVSVVGGIAWIAALTFSLVIIGLSASGSSVSPVPSESTSTESEAPTDTDDGDDSGDSATGTYDEAAFLAAVRPEILTLMQEVDPSLTEETLNQVFPDETLVSSGSSLLAAGDAGRDILIGSLSESGLFDEAQAARFYDTIRSAAEQYLVE